MWVYFWAFYPVPLICISVFVSVLHCFDDWICSILWSQGTCFFQLQFSFSRLHCYLGSIVFQYKLKLFFFYLCEKMPLVKSQRVDSLEKTLMLGGLGAGGKGNDRGWNGWMASPTRWMWVWVNSGSWWWTGRPGVLQSMGLQSRTWLSDRTEPNWCIIYS